MTERLDGFYPAGRSLLWAKAIPEEQGGGVELGCDCGTITHLIIDGAAGLTEPQEMAVTCDGCQTVRWFTVSPPPGA